MCPDRRIVAACLAVLVAAGGISGCGKKEPPKPPPKAQKAGPVLPPGMAVYSMGGAIWLLAKGQAPVKLVAGALWFPAISADETLVAYWEDLGENMALNILNVGSKAVTRVGQWHTLGAPGRSMNLHNAPAWLPGRNTLVFADGRQIWQVEGDGTNLQTIYEHTDGGCYSVSPSPDSTRMAFVSLGEKGQNLWVYSTLTHRADPVTEYTYRDGSVGAPAWCPAGEPIVFTLYKAEVVNLWRVPSEGGTSVQITKEGRTNGPCWDPTGKKLAASSGNQNPLIWQIHLINADDGRFLEQLTTTSPGAFAPSIAGAW